ncbi:MAG: cation-translocating P-type ATPase [Galactobacter sp.]|uniref:cation-translocating P-type ATPase n=1 Tax=Galactobacter sp. TaxID=2676125 RepID=UPI0025BB656C|nr:HAD-IC family P-type ATPase [Galactobacter sp.]
MQTTETDRTPWHALDPDEVRQRREAPEDGLSASKAAARLAEMGPNALAESKRDSWFITLTKQFRSPMVAFLAIAAVITAIQHEVFDMAVILLVLVLNATIGFWQARKSEADVRALQNLSSPEATVVRDGLTQRIDAADLVPGDTVHLESGDRVPADVRLTDVNSLQVDESMLTGEVLPASKNTATVAEEAGAGDRKNMAFSGTMVVSGRATGVVVETADRTELGAIATLVQTGSSKTPLQEATDQLEKYIGVALVASAVVIFAASLVMGESLSNTFRTTVALVVSAMPEALPIVLSVAMGVGVSRMAKHNAVVRNLPSVETLGSTTVIGSDKTGTLTVNRMTVERVWTPDGRVLEELDAPSDLTRAQRASLRTGALTNDATQHPEDESKLMGDAVDVAMATAGLRVGAVQESERAARPLADMPYEPDLAYSQTLHSHEDRAVLHVKGAPEVILQFCTAMAGPEGLLPVDVDLVRSTIDSMAEDGLRVIATAHLEMPDGADRSGAEGTRGSASGGTLPTPSGMVLTGLQGMMDPPRPGVADAIQQCREAGIHVMMITGDHPVTAAAIGARLGLDGKAPALTGAEMATLGDLDLLERLRTTSVAARMSPQDKLRIVKVLKADRNIVAITGDGVNDAPALKAASIGVAMGKSGTDVARESADLVLTDDNFVTIVDAVDQGRVTFESIRKATFFLLSNGIAALIAVAINTFSDLPLIFLPVMLLIMNVVTNGIQDIALSFEKGEGDELKQKPRAVGEGVLNRAMWLRTVITGCWMGAGTLVVYRLAHEAGFELDHCRTLALITMVMFNFFQVFSARAERKSLFTLNPFGNPFLLISAVTALVIQWALTVIPPAADLIGLSPLSSWEWLMCALVGASVLAIVEAEKFVRRVAHRRDARQAQSASA